MSMHFVTVFLQMKVVQGENSLLKSQTSKLKSLELEKKTLENRIQQLESAVTESKTNADILANIDTSGTYPLRPGSIKKQTTVKVGYK